MTVKRVWIFVSLMCWPHHLLALTARGVAPNSPSGESEGDTQMADASTSEPPEDATSKVFDPKWERMIIYAGGYWNSGKIAQVPAIGVDSNKSSTRGTVSWAPPLEPSGQDAVADTVYANLYDRNFSRNFIDQEGFSEWHIEAVGNQVKLGPWAPILAQLKTRPGIAPVLGQDVTRKIGIMAQWTFRVFYNLSPHWVVKAMYEIYNPGLQGNNMDWRYHRAFRSLFLRGEWPDHNILDVSFPGGPEATLRVFDGFKSLLNNATLNGEGAQRQLGEYRERLLNCGQGNGLIGYRPRVPPEIFNLTYGETNVLLAYMEDTHTVYTLMQERLRDYMDANSQRIPKYGNELADHLETRYSWALQTLRELSEQKEKSKDQQQDPIWVVEVKTAKVTRFPQGLVKAQP